MYFEEDFETSDNDKKAYYKDFTVYCEAYGNAAGRIGLQLLLFLDRYYHQKQSGTDFRD